jgi:hypothetical protein
MLALPDRPAGKIRPCTRIGMARPCFAPIEPPKHICQIRNPFRLLDTGPQERRLIE